MGELKQLINSRSSCRCFKDKSITHEELTELLHAGIGAPTAHNSQNYKIVVVQNDEVKKTTENILAELKQYEKWGIPIGSAKRSARILRDAPVNMYIFMKKNEFFKRGQVLLTLPQDYLDYITRENDVQDILSVGTVIENILLMAEELDLGAVCISEINTAKDFCEQYFGKYLNLNVYEFVSSIAVGYKEDIKMGKARRKDLEELTITVG